jgi:alpha-beta hydrolase superfamily lysophospholipase
VWDVQRPIANVVCLHGIVSHSGWYLTSGAFLAAHGFAVHMPDRRGSGLNSDARGDVDHWETWLTDVEQYLEQLSPGVPRILLGISWGGTLSVAIARHRPQLLAGLGLICPGLFSRKATTVWQRALLILAGRVGLARHRVPIPLRDPALFTNCETAKAYIASDPLTLWRITVRFALANLALTQYATEQPESIRVPTLAILAEQDPITVNAEVRAFVGRIGHDDRRVIEYPQASHTLEFEPDPRRYFEDLTGWCRDVALA